MLAKHTLSLNAALGIITTYQIIHVSGSAFGAHWICVAQKFLKIKKFELAFHNLDRTFFFFRHQEIGKKSPTLTLLVCHHYNILITEIITYAIVILNIFLINTAVPNPLKKKKKAKTKQNQYKMLISIRMRNRVDFPYLHE